MQIAKVVPKVRTQGGSVFDYAIPPDILPQIKIGLLVIIPFHGRNIMGIIIDIKRSSKILKLKSIIKIIDPIPVIDENHIRLANWMSKYYLTSLSQSLFLNIVPPAIRSIRTIEPVYSTTFFARAKKVVRCQKPYLIVGDFRTRLNYYKDAIEKIIAKNKSVIILVPDLDLIKYFDIKNGIVLHANMTRTNRWQAWDKIRKCNKSQVIIGSSSALFAPIQNLGLIIIDQEENETYKNDRSPRFHVVKTALKLSDITRSNIILGSITPSVESYFNALKNKYIFNKSIIDKKPNISIVDLNFQKELIGQIVEAQIKNNLINNKKTLVFMDRKGRGIKYLCQDCGWVFTCPKCNIPLTPTSIDSYCYNCGKYYEMPINCPRCQSVKLKDYGYGTGKLKKYLKKIFPKAKVILLDNSIKINPRITPWDIAVATSYALKTILPPIELVVIVDADQDLSFPDYRASEKSYQKIYKLLNIANNGIIQTHLPDSNFISTLASLNFDKFYRYEINNRIKFKFPPETQIIRLIYRHENKNIVISESNIVFLKLKDITAKNESILISEPSTAYFIQKNRFFRYQIIIRILGSRSKVVDELLNTLPSGWSVDVDPINLL